MTNVANATAKTPGLSHFSLSTLPSATDISGGVYPVPYLDYKNAGDTYNLEILPRLAKKIIYIWLGGKAGVPSYA